MLETVFQRGTTSRMFQYILTYTNHTDTELLSFDLHKFLFTMPLYLFFKCNFFITCQKISFINSKNECLLKLIELIVFH